MKDWEVTAEVTVDVKMRIKATTREEARAIFTDKIAMTAWLVDTNEDIYVVDDDGISDVSHLCAYE